MKSIERKINTIDERVGRLKTLSQGLASYEDYIKDKDARDIAERNLQVAIETCLDIGKIIIAQAGLTEPKDNKGIFLSLAAEGIISEKTLGFMAPMAGARNILVHGYDKIDDALIYGILMKHLDDFTVFLREIRDMYLKKSR